MGRGLNGIIKEGGIEKLSLFLEGQLKHQTPKSMFLSRHTHKIPRSKRGIHSKEKWESEVKIRKTFSNNFSKIIQQTFIEPLLGVSQLGWLLWRHTDEPDGEEMSVGKKNETQMRAILTRSST